MKRYDVAELLLKELRRIPKHLIVPSIESITKGKYSFTSDYLKTVSRVEIMLNLEKVLIQGCKTYNPKLQKPYFYYNKEIFYDYAWSFAEKIDNIRYRDITARNRVYFAYDFMLKIAKAAYLLKHHPERVKKVATTICLIAVISLAKMSYGGVDSILMNINPNDLLNYATPPGIEETVPNEEEDVSEELEEDNTLTQEQYIEPTPIAAPSSIMPEVNEDNEVQEELTKLSPEFPCELDLIIDWICDNFGFSREEFDIFAAVVIGESRPYDPYSDNAPIHYQKCYEDAYDVMSTIFNRTNDETWIWTNENLENLRGRSMYDHVIASNQFQRYFEGTYVEFLGKYDSPQFEAIINFFITQKPSHNYLKFYSFNTDMGSKTFMQRDSYSNKYWSEKKPENQVDYNPILFDLVSEDYILKNNNSFMR